MEEGQRISHYKILAELGQGGMGVVYKAEDTLLGRTVALKFFRRGQLGEESRSSLIREARAASKLDHPNICTVHQVEETEAGDLFICMTYCEGENLRKKIPETGCRIDEAVVTAIQIAEGLAHAHERGIVHRDVKPENVIVGTDGRARIMDFGLAKVAGQKTTLKTGTVAGTLAYMSPEQLKGGKLDHRTDVWSLGAVLYELLTGKPPFSGEYEAAISYSIVNEPVTPPSALRSGIPDDLERIVLKALEKRPEDRYGTMDEMLGELRAVRGQLAGEGLRLSTGGRAGRRRRALWGIAAVGAAAAAIIVVLVMRNLGGMGPPVSIAVLDFENLTGEERLDRMLAGLLTTGLAQSPRVRVLGRERMEELRQEMGLGSIEKPTGFELAERAGVQLVILGRALEVGTKLRIEASVYDVQSRQVLFARKEEGDGVGEIFTLIDALSEDIKKGLRVVPIWKKKSEPPMSKLTTGSVEAYRLYTKGIDLRTSQPMQAAEYLKQATTFDPEFFDAYIELTLLYKYQLGDYESALASAEKAKELALERSAKDHLKAVIYESWVRENWDSVIRNMREYLKHQPNDMRIQRRLGWVLAQREETYDEAIAQFEKVIELDPENVSGETSDAYNHLGNLYMYLGRTDEAIAALEKYRELRPGRPDPLHSLGNAYMMSGRYAEAVDVFSRILRDHPRYYITHESMALTYLAMGRWRDALASFMRSLTVMPKDYLPGGRLRIAQVYRVQGDYEVAAKEVEKALALDPGFLEAHWMTGILALEERGDMDAAEESLRLTEKLLTSPKAGGKECYVRHLRGRIELARGNVTEGLAELSEAARSCPRFESYFFHRELAGGYLKAGLPDEAIEVASEIIARNPNDAEGLTLLALAFEMKGDEERMNDYLNRALSVWEDADTDYGPLRTVLEKIE